ncbi:MAG: hypothetical protein ACREQ5_16215, partial [Candidatus Dormibacteria bacterium]
MPTYISPDQGMTPTTAYQGVDPYNGFLRGQNEAMIIGNQARGMQTQDLENQIQAAKAQAATAGVPASIQDSQNALQAGLTTAGQYASGAQQAASGAALQAKTSGSQAQDLDNKIKQSTAQAQTLGAIGQGLAQSPLNMSNPVDQQRSALYKSSALRAGIDLSSVDLSDPDNVKKLISARDAAVNSIQHLQTQQEQL